MFRRCALIAAVLMTCLPTVGETLNVPADHPTIQAAINAASDSDVINVAPGTYTGTVDLLGKLIVLQSTHGPELTTIDADGAGTAVTVATRATTRVRIEGFTITGGQGVNGGGMRIDGTSPVIINCILEGNLATGTGLDQGGGGLAVLNGAAPVVQDCILRNNRALSLGGGVMNIFDTTPRFINCLAHNNQAVFGGGFANEHGGLVEMTNCTVANNTANVAPGICNFLCTVEITNGIVHGHTQDITNLAGGASDVTYSNIGTGTPGVGNIAANPRFAADFSLQGGSPCIDAGTNDVPVFSSAAFPKDLAGKPRYADDPETPDSGAGLAPLIDMGVYERQPTCICNVAEDSVINIEDLLAYLALWFNADLAADITGNGTTDITDLLAFLACWFAADCI